MKDVFYSSKQFVNLPGCNSDASIFTQINFYSPEGSGYSATLKLRDCGNTVHYSIGLEKEGDLSYENSLFKIDVLIGELTKLREAMVKAKVIHDERIVLEREKFEENKENYEIHSRSDNRLTGNGANNTPVNPSGGLEDIQAAIFVAPNL